MSFPDMNLERTGVNPEVSAMVNGLGADVPRPPSDQDPPPNDQPAEVPERVYAPASERVPVPPVPGHRDMVEHTDTSTPERVAAGAQPEPHFARVPRPSGAGDTGSPPTGTWDGHRPDEPRVGPPRLLLGLSVSWLTVLGASVAVWLFLRWRRERNKPINRLRRRARQTSSVIRARLPSSRDEVTEPALGLVAAALSSLAVVWQQAQGRRRGADKLVSDAEWRKELTRLKKRWDPRRLELEKTSISRRS